MQEKTGYFFYSLGFHPSFSRHGKAQASLALLIWLNENVLIFFSYAVLLPAFSFLPCPIVPVLHEIAHSFEHIDVHKQEIVGDIED